MKFEKTKDEFLYKEPKPTTAVLPTARIQFDPKSIGIDPLIVVCPRIM
jgi:hypothetical protein